MVCNVDIPGLERGEGQVVAAHHEVAGDCSGDVDASSTDGQLAGQGLLMSTISPDNSLGLGMFF